MSDPVSTIEAAANAAQASASLLTSASDLISAALTFLPTLAYATTAAAAFFPPPSEDAPAWLHRTYKVVTCVAWNIRHAANATAQAKTDDQKEQSS